MYSRTNYARRAAHSPQQPIPTLYGADGSGVAALNGVAVTRSTALLASCSSSTVRLSPLRTVTKLSLHVAGSTSLPLASSARRRTKKERPSDPVALSTDTVTISLVRLLLSPPPPPPPPLLLPVDDEAAETRTRTCGDGAIEAKSVMFANELTVHPV